MFRRVVDEEETRNAEGQLVLAARLDCGHLRSPGLIRRSDAMPVARQWCETCHRLAPCIVDEEKGKATP